MNKKGTSKPTHQIKAVEQPNYKPDESKIAFDVLNDQGSGKLLIDVGAHFGTSLAPFAFNDWKVLAFEPDAQNRQRLEERFGKSQNVMIDTRALSDTEQGKATLYRSEQSTGISGLSSFHSSHYMGDEVEVTTLSSAMKEYGLTDSHVSFLKIDTEGFDLQVLRGFPWTSSSPELILCEFEDSKSIPLGYTFHDLADYLVEKGYKLIVSEWYPVKKYGGPHDWRRFSFYPCTLENSNAWGNIFATNREEIFQSLLNICRLAP